ncbi:hypothetical protein JL721_7312 [Aureococcus anophagefferens]|nr:hypothetical protein JL721_7312 [Aureococcus anophagefferens]
MSQWRIRDLQEMCARRVVACISQDAEGSSLLAQQLCFAPASVLEGLWAYAAESDRLSDALARAALAPGSEVCSLELGSVPLGITARRHGGVRALPALCGRVVVGWPSHFGATLARWLTRALQRGAARGGDGDRGQRRGSAAARAASCRRRGAASSAGRPRGTTTTSTAAAAASATTSRASSALRGPPRSRAARRRQMSALLGRARAAAHGEAASLAGVGDGELKSVLRAVDGVGLVAFKVSGAREAEGRFADALATCAPALTELRFRDAPAAGGVVRSRRPASRWRPCASTCGGRRRAAPAARRDAALALLAADDDFGDGGGGGDRRRLAAGVELALSESLADLAPFDAPFRGSNLRSLRVALVGHARREVRDDWLAALVAKLVALSLDRCVVKRLACAAPDRRPHCPVLAELTCARCRGGFGDRAHAEAAPRDFHALRRLRAPTDAFAAAFAAVSSSGGAALKSLTLDEAGDAGRSSCSSWLRATGAKHLALPVACPALRRLRLAACAALRARSSTTARSRRRPRASDRKLSAASDGHFGEMTPVKAGRGDDDDDEGDPLFELDDLDEARAPRGSVRFSEAASTPLRQPAFDDAARRRPRSAPSRTPDAPPPRGTPPNATPPSSERRRSSGKAAKASRSATKERFDPLLQCHVGCPATRTAPSR